MAGTVRQRSSGSRSFVVEPAAVGRLPPDDAVRIDAAAAAIDLLAPGRAADRDESGRSRTILIGTDRPAGAGGPRTIEIVVGGWRFELEVEAAGRADLRRRATRDPRSAVDAGGRVEIHAIIPGRVAAIAVAPGDVVAAGQTLLVVEAMKMQNELPAPRAGTVERIVVGVGDTIDLGDLLMVIG